MGVVALKDPTTEMKNKEKKTKEKERPINNKKKEPTNEDSDSLKTHKSEFESKSESESESEDDSENEDENALLVTPETEAEVLKIVALLKAKDPRVYQKDFQLYDDNLLIKAEHQWRERAQLERSQKPLTLRDIEQQKLLSGKLIENLQEEDEIEPVERFRKSTKTIFDYPDPDSQQRFKDEFKNAFNSVGEASFGSNKKDSGDAESSDDDLLKLRVKSNDEVQKEEEEFKAFLYQSLSADAVTKETANDWFSLKDDNIEEDDRFLIDYVINRGWIDKKNSGGHAKKNSQISITNEDIRREEEDEKAVEEMEQFEFKYNFRFEQPGSSLLVTHSRHVDDSLRLSTSKRKLQRAARKQRKNEERSKIEDQIKKAKNKMKSEMKQRVKDELDKDLQEEYLKLDFEDVVDGMPTRFKYRQVEPTNYGLSIDEILTANDGLLNEHAPLKSLAAFLPSDQQAHFLKKYTDKKRIYRFRGKFKESLTNPTPIEPIICEE